MAESTTEWDCVVSDTYWRYRTTCSALAGKTYISACEEPKPFQSRKARLYASVVPFAFDHKTADFNLVDNSFKDEPDSPANEDQIPELKTSEKKKEKRKERKKQQQRMPEDMPQHQGLPKVHKNTNAILKCTTTRGLLAPKRLKRHLGVNNSDNDTLQAPHRRGVHK